MSLKYAFDIKFSEHLIEDNIKQLIALDVPFARAGIQEYIESEVVKDGQNKIVKLYRPWDVVKASAPSFEGKPFIVIHPESTVEITIDNIRDFKNGHMQNVRALDNEEILVCDLVIDDKETIELIKQKKMREVSAGYFYDVEKNNDGSYTLTYIEGEHLALVDSGRAGEFFKIHDSKPLEKGKAFNPYSELEEKYNIKIAKFGKGKDKQHVALIDEADNTIGQFNIITKEFLPNDMNKEENKVSSDGPINKNKLGDDKPERRNAVGLKVGDIITRGNNTYEVLETDKWSYYTNLKVKNTRTNNESKWKLKNDKTFTLITKLQDNEIDSKYAFVEESMEDIVAGDIISFDGDHLHLVEDVKRIAGSDYSKYFIIDIKWEDDELDLTNIESSRNTLGSKKILRLVHDDTLKKVTLGG